MDKLGVGIKSLASRQFPSQTILNESGFEFRRFLVVADDLTGAADAAIALAGAKHSAEIFLNPDHVRATDNVITAVDLNTRRMQPAQAAHTVANFFTTMQACNALLFKKLDSTLRGHIGAELDALQRTITWHRAPELPPILFIVAPAHPLLGRGFVNGALELKNASAKLSGKGGSTLPPWEAVSIRSQMESFGFNCIRITTENLQDSNFQETVKLIQHAATCVKPALLCDARTVSDMQQIVAAASVAGARCVWAGSGGLASALNKFLPGLNKPEVRLCPSKKTSPGSTLFLIGSFSPTAKKQIHELTKTAQIQCVPLTIDKTAGHTKHSSEHLIDQAIANQQDVALYIAPNQSIRPDLSLLLADRMAALIIPRLGKLGALVCCGGDTTRVLFDKMQLTHLHAHNTPEPGVTQVYSSLWPQMPILIKAGAFGDAQTLLRLRQHLTPS